MSDVRDEELGALLDRTATAIRAQPVDRLPAVIRRGSRRRRARLSTSVVLVAVFAGAVSWTGLSIRSDQAIPADISEWRTFASLEENGWTIKVPPPWRIQELPACPNAPRRIGVIVTSVDFEFRNPKGGPPTCEDRFVFAGFPRDGVALAFMPTGVRWGIVFPQPETVFPLTPEQLTQTRSVRGGPAESYRSIYRRGGLIAIVRRWVGPDASASAVDELDRMLASVRVRGAPLWVQGGLTSLGEVRVSFLKPTTWTAAGYPHEIVIDAPTPILRLRSPGIGGDDCAVVGRPALRVGGFDDAGIEIVVSDGSDSFVQPDLPPRSLDLELDAAGYRRSFRCHGVPVRVLSFGFEEAGRPIFVDVVAAATMFRDQPEMIDYIIDRIRISKA